jgi:hypothetical protein
LMANSRSGACLCPESTTVQRRRLQLTFVRQPSVTRSTCRLSVQRSHVCFVHLPCCVSRPSGLLCASSRHSSRTELAIVISLFAWPVVLIMIERWPPQLARNAVTITVSGIWYRTTRDIHCAIQRGVPRSTARGWLTDSDVPVVTVEALNLDATRLQRELLQFRRRVQKLIALLRVFLVVLRMSGYSLSQAPLPDGTNKRSLLRAIERSRASLLL